MKRCLIPVVALMAVCCARARAEVNESPLNLAPIVAFPELKWTGWEADIDGKPNQFRPLLLTHAGDGSNRIFVITQQGVIHVFKEDSKETTVFLDLSKNVTFLEKEFEEGLLGLAFHPQYKTNGLFYIYWTPNDLEHTTVVSRFKVSKDDPNKADRDSEKRLLSVKHPFWNHKGGTVCFGPDGFLYIAMGDGGAANDPYGNGQNLQTLMGKILRIDVDRKDPGLEYAIPPDNPFIGRTADNPGMKGVTLYIARPEIYAYGLRNVWRMAFDRQTGKLWAADVGQNLWEEIDIIYNGGNYGWNLREGHHEFAPNSTNHGPGFVEPIWEYDHDVGKSITGGVVYRGKKFPELAGHYLYADYVSGRIWALKHDSESNEVVANRRIVYDGAALAVMSFGEDESGEVYFTIPSQSGKGIYTFHRLKK